MSINELPGGKQRVTGVMGLKEFACEKQRSKPACLYLIYNLFYQVVFAVRVVR
jgi:hypothetical protein